MHDIDAPCKNTAVCGESLGSELYFQQSVQAFSHLLLKQHCWLDDCGRQNKANSGCYSKSQPPQCLQSSQVKPADVCQIV